MCIPGPFYHCFGIVLSSLLCMSVGATQVLPSAVFEPGAVLRAVSEERCTVLHGVPTMFIAELEHPDFTSYDVTSLRTGIMAGAPCPVPLMKAVVERMHLSGVQIGYGQTEAAPLCTLTLPGDPFQARRATVGKVLPHQEIKIAGVGGRRRCPGASRVRSVCAATTSCWATMGNRRRRGRPLTMLVGFTLEIWESWTTTGS